MGAWDFKQEARGKSANEAFNTAVASARHEHGHGGYTGTIAEKSNFVMIPLPAADQVKPFAERRAAARRLAEELLDTDRRINDKWGPAGCIDLGPLPGRAGEHGFLFFGWASS